MVTIFELTAQHAALAEERRARMKAIAAEAAKHLKRWPGDLSRAEMHALLDACLDLKALDLDGQKWRDPNSPAGKHARPLARALVNAAFAWIEPNRPSFNAGLDQFIFADEQAWMRLETDPDRWRMEVIQRLRSAPHTLPGHMVEMLIGALDMLNDGSGDVPWLLRPERTPGRGRNPKIARAVEEDLWRWIHYQKGSGRLIDTATAEVASACGCTTDNVKKWRADWRKRAGAEAVAKSLKEAVAAGKAGQDIPPDILTNLAESWREARTPAKADKEFG